jgi:RNA polymerase sigma factor (sigma-70 family)
MRTEHENRALFEAHRWDIERYAEWLSTRFFIAGCENADIKQELVLQVFDKIGTWDPRRGPLNPFVKRIMNLYAITMLKRSQRFKHQGLNTAVSLHDLVSEERRWEDCLGAECSLLGNVEQRIENEHRIALLRQELTQLEFTVLMLRARNYSYPEITAETGVKEKAIDNALTRARRKIATHPALSVSS